MTATVNTALLIFRVVLGLTLMGHGTQKLFGWFGGAGFSKQCQLLGSQGYKPAWLWTTMAIVGELGGGLSLVFGFLTPLGAAGIFGAMIMATRVNWKKGFFIQKGGYEYTLMLVFAALTFGLIGPGSYSLD